MVQLHRNQGYLCDKNIYTVHKNKCSLMMLTFGMKKAIGVLSCNINYL